MKQQDRNFSALLLAWYDEQRRDLPWRKSGDPYHIWVSEIMLQQTRVEAVIPYYTRFVSKVPTIAALAHISDDELMKLWEGLGYYSRARNLKKAAMMIMESNQGIMPNDMKGLLSLPGIGPYTAGAIGSIAFYLPVAAIDGNVLRVFSRVFAILQDVGIAKTKKMIEDIVVSLLPQKRVGDFNQAIMELGATVCIPNGQPLCQICPLASMCLGYKQGLLEQLPVKSKKKKRRIQQMTVICFEYENEFLVCKRAGKGLLVGMYEFYNCVGWLCDTEIERLVTELGGHIEFLHEANSAEHIFTHLEWHMHSWKIRLKNKIVVPNGYWVNQEQLLDDIALPTAFKKLNLIAGE